MDRRKLPKTAFMKAVIAPNQNIVLNKLRNSSIDVATNGTNTDSSIGETIMKTVEATMYLS